MWPPSAVSQKLDDLEPGVAAAIAYLRAQQSLIDANRIGLLGHSDGATAAIIAASADWDVRATVAVSASVGPWQLVNHVAPQNLLLVYGAEDHFIVNDTDSALIARGTRGYLDAPGQLGSIADGTGRRLVRIAGRGHVDVVFSDSARPEILHWLRQSLLGNAIETRCGNGGCLAPSPHRWWWVGVGATAILLALITAPTPRHHRVRVLHAAPLRPLMRSVTLVLAWVAGLALAPWFVRQGQALVPGHEGSVLTGLLLGPATSLTVLGMMLLGARRAARACTDPASRRECPQGNVGLWHGRSLAAHIGLAASSAARGVLASTGLFIASYLLLLHHYEIGLSLSRLTLLLFFATAALPAFATLELWLWWVARDNRWRSAGALALLAGGTAVLSGQLFERMSVAPGYLLSAALLLLAAYRIGRRHTCSPIASVVLGATTIGWFGANVCALY